MLPLMHQSYLFRRLVEPFYQQDVIDILQGMPLDGSTQTTAMYAVVLLIFALIKAWPAPACNNPLFAEIVAEPQRTLIYAFDRYVC